MPFRAGLLDNDELEHKPAPDSMQDLIKEYQKYSQLVLASVEQKWTDSSLKEVVNMYGEDWPKGKILSVLIHHQIHHRGQMTTLMRLLNMEVPGLYGPSKEEWVKYGMTPME